MWGLGRGVEHHEVSIVVEPTENITHPLKVSPLIIRQILVLLQNQAEGLNFRLYPTIWIGNVGKMSSTADLF